MKQNRVIILLIAIIMLLTSYIIYDKFFNNNITNVDIHTINVIDEIKLDYVSVYLTDDGISYLVPIKDIDTDKSNLKERLNTLYNRAFYYDIYVNNEKIKGFKVELDSKIEKIQKIEINDLYYVIFIKDNHTIGVFDYDSYYNLLDTEVKDNYNDYKNVSKIENNKIYYLDGKKEEIIIKESDNL